MNNSKTRLFLSSIIFFSSFLSAQAAEDKKPSKVTQKYTLEQILIFSRHSIRTPDDQEIKIISQITKKPWHKWPQAPGELTTKGMVASTYMGRYTGEWLIQKGIVEKNECPDSKKIHVYTNSFQRTIITGRFFIDGAFPTCNIPVHYKEKINTMDPVFSISLKDKSPTFQKEWADWMEKKISTLDLKKPYKTIEKILDFKNSPYCESKEECSLTKEKTTVNFIPDRLPSIVGPLEIASAASNVFMLQYYEGLPTKEVAWGELKNKKKWNLLSETKKSYHNVLFSFPKAAEASSYKLLETMSGFLVNEGNSSEKPKISVMVGHDSNISSMLTAIGTKEYELPDQYEKTPIGGNLQFQRWRDPQSGKEFFKLEYVYQTVDQLHNATELTQDNPPHRVLLSLKECPIDANGFCSWKDFVNIMKKFQK